MADAADPPVPPDRARSDLARLLVQHLGAGTLDAADVLPAVELLAGRPEGTRRALLHALLRETHPAFAPLVERLREARAKDALRHFELRSAGQPIPVELADELADLPLDAPLGWADAAQDASRLGDAAEVRRDRAFVRPRRETLPVAAAAVEEEWRAVVARLGARPTPWTAIRPLVLLEDLRARLGPDHPLQPALAAVRSAIDADVARSRSAEALGPDDDEDAFLEGLRDAFRAAADAAQRRRLLDRVLLWPTVRAARVLPDLGTEPWAQERASLVLTLRFGQKHGARWGLWRQWLDQARVASAQLRAPATAGREELLCLYYASRADHDAGTLAALEEGWADRLPAVSAEVFATRWGDRLPPAERRLLVGTAPAEPAPSASPSAQGAATAPPTSSGSAPPVPPPRAPEVSSLPPPLPSRPVARRAPPAPPPAPPRPSLWRVHVQGFLAENWYIVAGIAMVL